MTFYTGHMKKNNKDAMTALYGEQDIEFLNLILKARGCDFEFYRTDENLIRYKKKENPHRHTGSDKG